MKAKIQKIYDELLVHINEIIYVKTKRTSFIIACVDSFLIVSLLLLSLNYYFMPIQNHISWYGKENNHDPLIFAASELGSVVPFLIIPSWYNRYFAEYNAKLWRYLLR